MLVHTSVAQGVSDCIIWAGIDAHLDASRQYALRTNCDGTPLDDVVSVPPSATDSAGDSEDVLATSAEAALLEIAAIVQEPCVVVCHERQIGAGSRDARAFFLESVWLVDSCIYLSHGTVELLGSCVDIEVQIAGDGECGARSAHHTMRGGL